MYISFSGRIFRGASIGRKSSSKFSRSNNLDHYLNIENKNSDVWNGFEKGLESIMGKLVYDRWLNFDHSAKIDFEEKTQLIGAY